MSREIIHKSLHRPKLLLGVDRELLMWSGLIPAITAMSGQNLVSYGAAAIFWFVSLYWLRKWAKQDPQMRDVALNFLTKQYYYPARTGLYGDSRTNNWRQKIKC